MNILCISWRITALWLPVTVFLFTGRDFCCLFHITGNTNKLIRDLQCPWWANCRYRAVCGNSVISSVSFCFFYCCEIWTRPMETTSFYSMSLHYFVWMRAVRMPIFSKGHEFSLSWFYNIQPLTPIHSGVVCIAITWVYKHSIAIIMKL